MTDLDRRILAVITAAGGRFERPGFAIDCLAEHLPNSRPGLVKRRVEALADAGHLVITRGGRFDTTRILELGPVPA